MRRQNLWNTKDEMLREDTPFQRQANWGYLPIELASLLQRILVDFLAFVIQLLGSAKVDIIWRRIIKRFVLTFTAVAIVLNENFRLTVLRPSYQSPINM